MIMLVMGSATFAEMNARPSRIGTQTNVILTVTSADSSAPQSLTSIPILAIANVTSAVRKESPSPIILKMTATRTAHTAVLFAKHLTYTITLAMLLVTCAANFAKSATTFTIILATMSATNALPCERWLDTNIPLPATASVTFAALPARAVSTATRIAVIRTVICAARSAKILHIHMGIFAPKFAKAVVKNVKIICLTGMKITAIKSVMSAAK